MASLTKAASTRILSSVSEQPTAPSSSRSFHCASHQTPLLRRSSFCPSNNSTAWISHAPKQKPPAMTVAAALEGPRLQLPLVGMQPMAPPKLTDLDPTNMMIRQRIVWLGGQVDDITADGIISQLLLLDAQDPTKDIKLFINSPGGSVTAGMGIFDAMNLCRCDVSTITFGLAASMGAFLLAAGTKGKRYAMPNARIMIHQPLGGGQGSAIDFAIQAEEIMYHKARLNGILSERTGKTTEQLEEDTDRDYFMDAWEAKDYGMVDEVIDIDGCIAPRIKELKAPKTKINEYWAVRGRKAITLRPKKERKRMVRQS